MTSQEVIKAKHKPGYWFENVAPIGEKPDWQEKLKPHNQSETLFGYDIDEFMAKQYK